MVRLLFLCTLIFLLLLGATAAGLAAVVVNPSNMDGWAFNVTSPTGVGDMVIGPATPPLGVGSAHLSTGIDGDESAQIRNVNYNGVAISSLTSLGYSDYATQWNGQQVPYLTLTVSFGNSGTADDILFFEPPYQTPASGNPSLPDQGNAVLNTWQSWDALAGGWWANSGDGGLSPGTGVKPLSDYLAVHPNAQIFNPSGLGGVRILTGFADAGTVFEGNVDAVTIGVNNVSTTFDFEPTQPVPEPMSIMLSMLGIGAIGGLRRLRRS